MTPTLSRRGVAGLALVFVGLVLSLMGGGAAGAQQPGPTVDVLEVTGVIDATLADYVVGTLDKAAREESEVIVMRLDTPGGLGSSMDDITKAIIASPVPVTVWIGPPGAQAASAGVFIGYSAHMFAMAPGTSLGAATPVDLGGGDLERKATNAAVGRLEALAQLRDRDPSFAADAVRDATVLTAAQARDRGVADFLAPSLPDVLRELDGRTVGLGADAQRRQTLDVDPALANVRFNNLGLVARVLHTVANPTLAYLLLIAGATAILFEVFQPGFGVAGVAGLILGALGLYGLSVLPVNWLAFGLVVLGLVLLAADLAVAGLGLLTLGGAAALAVGSLLLFEGPPILRVSPWLVTAVVAGTVAFFVLVMTTVLRAQGGQAMAGAEGLVGHVGVVRSVLNPEGMIFVGGALWRARAPASAGWVGTGRRVRVLRLDDRLTLDVVPADDDPTTPAGTNAGGEGARTP